MEKIKNLMTHRMAFLCLYLMLPLGIFAQSISVTGVVKDASGETVIGATVREKGTDNATVTDLDGNYTIRVAPKAALVFSYVGYKSAEVNVGGRTSVNVTLQEDNHTLNELVVIGYGTMKKATLREPWARSPPKTWRTPPWPTSVRPCRAR